MAFDPALRPFHRKPIATPHLDCKPLRLRVRSQRSSIVTALIAVVAWCILFVLCWPLALLALVLWPIAWLLALPFRLVGITFAALFALLQAILFLPARLLGWRPAPTHAQRAATA